MFVPALLGSILVSKLPSHDKVGLLFSYWISSKPIFILNSCLNLILRFVWQSSFSPPLWFFLAGLHLSSLAIQNVSKHPFSFPRWVSAATLTPGTTTNAIILSAYAIGNAAGPFMWKKQYQPRYICFIGSWPLTHFLKQPRTLGSYLGMHRGLHRFDFDSSIHAPFREQTARTWEKRWFIWWCLYYTRIGWWHQDRETSWQGTLWFFPLFCFSHASCQAFLDITDIQNRDFRYVLWFLVRSSL